MSAQQSMTVAPAVPSPPNRPPGRTSSLRASVLRQREIPLLLVIVGFGFAMWVARPDFLTTNNLTAVGIAITGDAVIAIAMTALLVSGGFDLSVGSVLALSGVSTGLLITVAGWPVLLAVLAGLAVGALVGFVNGSIVTWLRVNPLITTFGMLSVASSIALVITQSRPLSGFPASFTFVGQERIGQLPVVVLLVLVLVVIADLILRKSRAARSLFYVGSNEDAAALSGINVKKVRLVAFVLVGLAAALAGLIVASRLNAAYPLAGQGTELRVIAACVIGGCSLTGGEGSVIGSFLGVILLGLVNNAIVLLNISIAWQGAVSGGVLIVAVILNQYGKRRRARVGAPGG